MSSNYFKNKVILITGATSGIGLVTAVKFANSGAIVVGVARNAVSPDLVNKNIMYLQADVANEKEIIEVLTIVDTKFGKLDFAFNNAGILGEKATIDTYPVDKWHEVINTNLNGVFFCVKHEIALMKKYNSDVVIINNASMAGLTGSKVDPAYTASKHAVVGLTKAIINTDSKIHIHAICPPGVRTPMRLAYSGLHDGIEPEEVADVVSWLCSEQAKNLNGEILTRQDWLTKMSATKH